MKTLRSREPKAKAQGPWGLQCCLGLMMMWDDKRKSRTALKNSVVFGSRNVICRPAASNIIHELVKNAESQTPPKTYRLRICLWRSPPGDAWAHWHLRGNAVAVTVGAPTLYPAHPPEFISRYGSCQHANRFSPHMPAFQLLVSMGELTPQGNSSTSEGLKPVDKCPILPIF